MGRRWSAFILAACYIILVWTPDAYSSDEATTLQTAFSLDLLYNAEVEASVVDGRVDFEATRKWFSVGGAYRDYRLSSSRYNPRGLLLPLPVMKHRYAGLHFGDFDIRVGHFFETFGHGLTLRSFEEIELEHDTLLDGIIGISRFNSFEVHLLSGSIVERLSSTQRRKHRLTGGNLTMTLRDRLSLSFSALKRKTTLFDDQISLPEDKRRFEDEVYGVGFDLFMGRLSLSGEYATRDGGYYPALTSSSGRGLYLSCSVSSGLVNLLGEYKNYERFENALINPPTCVKEHTWTLINRRTHIVDLNGEKGFLVEADVSLPSERLLQIGASEARDETNKLASWEMYAQVENPLGAGFVRSSVVGSWSREYVEGRFTEYISAGVETDVPVGGTGLELQVEAQQTELPDGSCYDDFLSSVALYMYRDFTISALYEVTSEKGLAKNQWLFVELRWQVTGDFQVGLGIGSERGGKKCSGGICYNEPEFTGVRMRLSAFL